MSEPISIKEAARRLGVTPKEIRRRIKDGELDGMVRLPDGTFGTAVGAGLARGFEEPQWPAQPSQGLTSVRRTGAMARPAAAPVGPMVQGTQGAQGPQADGDDSQAVIAAKDAEIRRLEDMVRYLRDELDSRRREVQELHVLLREHQRSAAQQAMLPPPVAAQAPAAVSSYGGPAAAAVTAARVAEEEQTPAAVLESPAPTEVSAPVSPSGPEPVHALVTPPPAEAERASAEPAVQQELPDEEGDEDEDEDEEEQDGGAESGQWQPYDAESEQLKATMGRLQALLDQLEEADEAPVAQVAQPAPVAQTAPPAPAPPAPVPTPVPVPAIESGPAEVRQAATTQAAPAGGASVVEPATEVHAAPAAPVMVPEPESVSAAPREPVRRAPAVDRVEMAPPASEPTATPVPASAAAAALGEPPLGAALAKRREGKGISREALAASSGLAWGFITEVERGRRRDVRSRQRVHDALEQLIKQRRDGQT